MIYIDECKNYEDAKMLFVEYSKLKGAEQCFVSFEKELQNIKEIYPEGKILLGFNNNEPIGCIAIKEISKDKCELKRLYVKEAYHGNGYSKLLFEEALKKSKGMGFNEAIIYTLPDIMEIGYKRYLKSEFVEQKQDNSSAVLLSRAL